MTRNSNKMIVNRPIYLQKLIESRHNHMIKVILNIFAMLLLLKECSDMM